MDISWIEIAAVNAGSNFGSLPDKLGSLEGRRIGGAGLWKWI